MAEDPVAVVNLVTRWNVSVGMPEYSRYINSQDPKLPPCHSASERCFVTSSKSVIMVQFNSDVVAAAAAALNFTQVALTPPLDWIAGSSLFPSQIIAGYNAPLDEYTAEEWSAHILDACQSFEACTSADGFQGMFSVIHLVALRDPPALCYADSHISNEQW